MYEFKDILLITLILSFYFYVLLFECLKNTKFNKYLELFVLAFFIYTMAYAIYIILINQNLLSRIEDFKSGHSLTLLIFSIFYIINFKNYPILKTIFFIISGELLWNLIYIILYNDYSEGVLIMVYIYILIFALCLVNLNKLFAYGFILLILYALIWVFAYDFKNTAIWLNDLSRYDNSELTHLVEIGYWIYYLIIITILQKIISKNKN